MRPRANDQPEELPKGPRGYEVLDDPKQWPLLAPTVARWEEQRPLLHTFELPLYVRTEMKLQLVPEQWRTGFLSVEEAQMPPDLYAVLREKVPQALLRDLHRPVKDFYVHPETVTETDTRHNFTEAYRSLGAARAVDKAPRIEPMTLAVREEQDRRRRELVDTPWQPVKPDDAPRDAIKLFYNDSDIPTD